MRRLTYPVTRDLGASALEVPYAVRGAAARLRVRDHDLLDVTFDERDGEALVAIIVGHSRQVGMRRLG